MGACISSHISKPNQLNKHMDYHSAPASKPPTNFVIAASPIGEKPSLLVTRPMPDDLLVAKYQYHLSSSKFRSFGSKEDVFFESQPWLESDGDDEFFSVNGEKTPSIASSARNTPKHMSLSATPSHSSEDTAAGYKLTLSPVTKRKSLSELFKEDEEEDNEYSNQDTSSSDEDTMKFNPNVEAPKSEQFRQHTFANNNVDVKVKKDRSHSCFPRVFSAQCHNMAKKNSIAAAQ